MSDNITSTEVQQATQSVPLVKRKRGRPPGSKAKKEQAAREALDSLTERQKNLVVKMSENLDGKKSDKILLAQAGYSPGSNTTEVIRNPKIREALRLTLEAKGITTDLIGDVLYDGITAREDHNDINSKPERITRLKYLEKILQILGMENLEEKSPKNWEGLITSITINNLPSQDKVIDV